MVHTILGAGGAISIALAEEILRHNEIVRLVSRSGFEIDGAQTIPGDLTSYSETVDCIKGSDIVYLCAGLPYDSRVWSEFWHILMNNTIEACKNQNTKLIFFDNVYMYGKVDGKMTEKTPYNPCSKKGEVRAKIASSLENEIKAGNINAIIARSADFYGPYSTNNSYPFMFVFEKLMSGGKVQWMLNDTAKHSFTYTLDCGKALYILAKAEAAWNQVWHLPTAGPALTGKEFIELSCKIFDKKCEYDLVKKWSVRLAAMFNRTISEAYEMLYQNENDYVFDSSKFNDFFEFIPTSYELGIKETFQFFQEEDNLVKY